MLCVYFVPESRLIVVINKRALNVFSYASTVESLHYLRVWIYLGLLHWCFENEQVLLEYRAGFWFLFVCWISWNVLCGIYLGMNVSGEVCGEVVSRSLMSKSAAFLSKLTNVKMYKHLRGVNAFVFFLTCSLEANPSYVPLREMLDMDVLDPAKLPQRESKNDYVDLVSRSREADDGVWVGHNEALDRTMSATGSRTVHGEAISDIDGQSDRDDVANGVFLRKIIVSVENELSSAGVKFQTFNPVSKNVPEVFEIECCRGQRASAIYFLCSSLF